MSHLLKLFQSAQGRNGDPLPAEANFENVEAPTGLPRISVEQVRIEPELRLIYHTDPTSPVADRFRLLRGRLHELTKRAKLKTLLVTSPLPGDGKSTVALNLATALAEGGERSVLLIDADLHNSSLTEKLGLGTWPGLAESLDAEVDPLAAVRRLEPLGFCLLPTGQKPSVPTDLLQTPTLSTIVDSLSRHFDWIVIDSPPVMPITDALCLKQVADGILLVVKAGKTPQTVTEEALTRLGREHIVGILLNGVEEVDHHYGKYYRGK